MRFFSSIYVLLLAYIVTAVVFWEMSLQKLSGRIYAQQLITLQTSIDSTAHPAEYNKELQERREDLTRRTKQYIAEGSTFIIVILIGAVVVYSSFKRRIALSKQQNNFMLSVTHELKTPIAAIKLNLQTIEKHKLSEEKKDQLLGRSIKEANRLNDLCNNILFASQLDGGIYKHSREKFDFSELAEDSVMEYSGRYPERFEDNIGSGCYVTGDKVMLQMAINNLLENAVKYTPAGSPIRVELHKRNNEIVLQVIDEGAGIPDSEKKKIFDKFYRVGSEETRNAKGTGLGLYLVCKVVTQNKGDIIIKDNQPTGAIFEITLPLDKA
ncbi:two-component sensor histidine kinase [Flavipsychrobacter stenotrophus]|uniref:histidine kinase n=1 Tax=Flavipsychrobacter stenotrophus TaxID=2077091 RepID=A0A2S7SSU8_9BACT|nr:ATP-binding protein [Flavipsychrobacter stenotrophus]PQJ09677.1 two-component sensor histidine kinase [Flavipsychrobacter stenotrophus]